MQRCCSKRTPVILALFLLLVIALLTFRAEPANAAASSGNASSGNASSVWGANYFPDVPLVTQDGKPVRFFTDLIKGKVVLINFIFTSCPDECGLETARLSEVQRILKDRVGKDVFLYSISIDPEHDTPKVLKAYSEKFQVGPGWLFLTGKDADITQLRKKLGLYSEEKDAKLQDHNLSLIMGNQSTGQWMKISSFENPYMLANQLGGWLHNWKMPAGEQRDYTDAPKVRNISTGESLFRTRCSACHTIGEEGAVADKRFVGPDLFGVTKKRNAVWLNRWLLEPDKMINEKDPLALELLSKFNNLPMPNLRLSDPDIKALITFMDDETQRIEHQRMHHHAEGHDHGAAPDHSAGHDHTNMTGHDHMNMTGHDHMNMTDHDHKNMTDHNNIDMKDMNMDDPAPAVDHDHDHGATGTK